MPRRTNPRTDRLLNHRVETVLRTYVRSCIHGTEINTKDLARQLSNQEYVYLAGTLSRVLAMERMRQVQRLTQSMFRVI
jgi:hypothetical protein